MRGACEIVELKDEVGSSRYRQTRMQNRDQKPPLIKKGTSKFLQDDINKLFEAIDLRSTKSLDLSDRRNASKKPMRIGGSSSPGIGFSEPVSLKQALRGMCISQAAEMASTKRLSKPPGSPSMLEPGKVSTFYTSGDNRYEVSLVPEESTSNSSSFKLPWYIQDPKSKSASHSAHSSPRFFHKSTVPESTQLKTQPEPKVNHSSLPLQPVTVQARKEHDSSVPNKGTKNPSKSVSTSPRLVTKTTPKVRKKGRVQTLQSSSATKSNKDNNSSIKTNSRPGKPAKSIVKKKEKHESPSNEVSGSTSQLTCQKCQCHVNNDHAIIPEVVNKTSSDISTPPPKLNKLTKTKEQGEFSQSSKSSIGEYSSSTTISEESNLSGNGSGNRPHMSKDIRWEAIANVRKQHGFLGLSHFNLLKKLGSGDIGTVYLAELIGTNCFFAIKVMDNEFLVRRKKMTRAQTEREILRMLDHPFLPTLFAQFTSDNLSCLVMEFCPGGDLHVLRQKQLTRYFPEQAARFYVAEVLLALEYLHMLGIIYRDLKPENIMVREDGHIMLTDFDLSLRCSVNPTLLKSPLAIEPPRMSGPCAGSNCIDPFCAAPSCKVSCFTPRILPSSARARKLKADVAAQAKALPQLVAEPTEARSNSFVGTHEYLAPEIIKGDGHGSAVDWWTLGIFLYELLYGKTPFKGSGNEETLTNVVLQSLKFPDSPMVSFQARDLIRGLLIKEPENRFGTQTGAAEIKRHPFFDGLNWALIRCAIPPEIPEVSDVGVSDNERRFLECNNATGEHLEFELF